MLLEHLGFCMNSAIWECPQDPAVIFRGCPETAQLAWRTMDALGHGLDAVVIQGKGKESETGRWVDHVWVELPVLGLRIETNASQILGMPLFVQVLDIRENDDRYRDGFEHMEILDRVTPAGDRFYSGLAQEIAACVRKRSAGK